MANQAEFRRLVLAHLTVIDETENPSPEQASLMDLFIAGSRARLAELGLCWWDSDAVPDAVTLPYMRYVASQACTSFGRGGKGYEAAEAQARADIAALKSSEQREEQRAEYF
jgi:hypothetical protein